MKTSKVGNILFVVLIALALTLIFAPFAGYHIDNVRSASMSPTINVGNLAVTVPVQDEDIEVGDVISFTSPTNGETVCHRVIEVSTTGDYARTKGDANEDPDPFFVPFDNVNGRVDVSIPLLGYFVSFLQSIYGWALILCLGALLLLMDKGEGNLKREDRKGGEG